MKKTITKYKWFWAWQDEAEENWLEEMSKQGYHLSSLGTPSFYHFTISEPKHYIYRLDYQFFHKKDKGEYLQLFRDSGWEHIGKTFAWEYFRKEANNGEVPEIYTDVESKVAKYKRILTYLGAFYIVIIAIFSTHLVLNEAFTWWSRSRVPIILLIVLVFMTYAIARLFLRIRKLRKKII